MSILVLLHFIFSMLHMTIAVDGTRDGELCHGQDKTLRADIEVVVFAISSRETFCRLKRVLDELKNNM